MIATPYYFIFVTHDVVIFGCSPNFMYVVVVVRNVCFDLLIFILMGTVEIERGTFCAQQNSRATTKGKFVSVQNMRSYEGLVILLHTFLTPAIYKGRWQLETLSALPPSNTNLGSVEQQNRQATKLLCTPWKKEKSFAAPGNQTKIHLLFTPNKYQPKE